MNIAVRQLTLEVVLFFSKLSIFFHCNVLIVTLVLRYNVSKKFSNPELKSHHQRI